MPSTEVTIAIVFVCICLVLYAKRRIERAIQQEWDVHYTTRKRTQTIAQPSLKSSGMLLAVEGAMMHARRIKIQGTQHGSIKCNVPLDTLSPQLVAFMESMTPDHVSAGVVLQVADETFDWSDKKPLVSFVCHVANQDCVVTINEMDNTDRQKMPKKLQQVKWVYVNIHAPAPSAAVSKTVSALVNECVFPEGTDIYSVVVTW